MLTFNLHIRGIYFQTHFFKQGREMITTEFVMAVLCAPLSGKDLLNAERENNVRIIRKLEYHTHTDYFKGSFFGNLANSPLKLLFIFGLEDVILVCNADDERAVQQRLARA